jgi:hypothetical protein
VETAQTSPWKNSSTPGGKKLLNKGNRNMYELKRLTRRDFLKIAGGSVIAAAAASVFLSAKDEKTFTTKAITKDSVPVQNPAYSLAETRIHDQTVLYCQTSDGKMQAYALTPAGYEIWKHCTSHEQFMAGKRKSLKGLSDEMTLGDYSNSTKKFEAIKKFVYIMQSKGLIFQVDSDVKIYIPRHG